MKNYIETFKPNIKFIHVPEDEYGPHIPDMVVDGWIFHLDYLREIFLKGFFLSYVGFMIFALIVLEWFF